LLVEFASCVLGRCVTRIWF